MFINGKQRRDYMTKTFLSETDEQRDKQNKLLEEWLDNYSISDGYFCYETLRNFDSAEDM
jgi:hypothetical protein